MIKLVTLNKIDAENYLLQCEAISIVYKILRSAKNGSDTSELKKDLKSLQRYLNRMQNFQESKVGDIVVTIDTIDYWRRLLTLYQTNEQN